MSGEVLRSGRVWKMAVAGGGTLIVILLALQLPPLMNFSICPYQNLFHVDCPGCGMTRGMAASMQGHFESALAFHPLSPVVLTLLFLITGLAWWDVLRKTSVMERLWSRCGAWASMVFLVAILAVWVWRQWLT